MAYISNAQPNAGLLNAVNGVFSGFVQTVGMYRTYLRTKSELESLTLRELDDLGINRGDIQRIAKNSAFN